MGAAQLGLSADIQAFATETEGLVLIAGGRGSGKTTLVGALVDLVNRQRSAYVITLEQQIGVVHEPHHALISQREVSGTPEQWVHVAASAVRENPDVMVFEEIPSAEVLQLALEAAGTGVLVFVTVNAPSSKAALARLLALCPEDTRASVRAQLAERMRGGVAQALLRRTAGGRIAAREVLLMTPAVVAAIENGRLEDLTAAMESARQHGLVSLNDALIQHLRVGAIDLREAYRKTDHRDALVIALKRENLGAPLLERLA
jgi:twitching motility protein PilT